MALMAKQRSQPEKTMSSLECQEHYFAEAAHRLDCDEEMQSLLRSPQRQMIVEVPLRREDGSVETFKGYRVQHNNARGPFKGGLRFHPKVTLNHFNTFAALMTWKAALMDLPFGGAKGGIQCDPQSLSSYDLETLVKRYTDKLNLILGPRLDIPAPDVGARPEHMAWIFEAYSKYRGYEPEVVTGKPLELGGIQGRLQATGKGVALMAQWAAEKFLGRSEDFTVAVQGFGNVGAHAAFYLDRAGARVVAISDSKGAIYNDQGLDIRRLFVGKWQEREYAALSDVPVEKEDIASEDLMTLDVDVLIPAALEAAIHEDNIDNVRAKVIVEAANSPVTCFASYRLEEKGIPVIPDIMANAGGVVASYLEWRQNHQRHYLTEAFVFDELERILKEAWANVFHKVEHDGLSPRLSAYMIAIQKVREAILLRGF